MAQSGYTPISLYYTTTAAAVPTSGNLVNGELAINITDGKLYYKNNSAVVTLLASSGGASGDVVGPASSTDNALARFDLATGKLIQNSVGLLSDAGILTGLTGVTSSGPITLSSLTSGRVTYAGTAGLLQDSAALTYDGTAVTINKNSSALPASPVAAGGMLLQLGNADATQTSIVLDSFGTGQNLNFRRANGTNALKTGASGAIGQIRAYGYGSTAYSGIKGQISFTTEETWTDSAQGLRIDFTATAIGTTTSSVVASMTSTGLNSTAIGATTPSTGAFTTLSATGRTTINSPVNTDGRLAVRQNSDANPYFGLIVESNAVPNFLALGYNGTNWCISPSYSGAGAYKDVAIFSNNSKVAEFLSTGLAVTGTLSATQTVSSTLGFTASGQAAAVSGSGFEISGGSVPDILAYNRTGSAYLPFNMRGLSFTWQPSGSTAMTLDSSGNLGLGVTPSAWWGNMKAVQVGGSTTSVFAGAAVNTNLVSNAYYDGTNWKYVSNGFASEYEQTAGAHKWYSVAYGTAATNLAGGVSGANFATAAMTLDASGNLLVGATAVGNGGKLYVNGSISLGTSTTGAQSSMAKDTTQLTTSISTSATTIYTDIASGMSSASAGYFIIYGSNNAGAGFMDVVIAKASGTPVVVSSSTVEGSPAARTYSVSSYALRLTMASGTYSVNLKATVLGYPF